MIYQGPCDSFRRELATATHDFDADVFKIALFTSSADLGPLTTVYSATNEVSGTGYSAGGATLTPTRSFIRGSVVIDFDDVEWASSTITARGALIYNSSKSDKAVWVLNFGSDRTSSNSSFPIVFPTPDELSGIIRW